MHQILKPIKIISINRIPKPFKVFTKPIYNFINLVYYKLLDLLDLLKGNRNPLIPPRSMIFIGGGNYIKTGDEYFTYFKELGGLKSNDKVLDVGCGIGRMSVPLTKYLSKQGEYHGFDIVKEGIDWCKNNISPLYPNFHYEHSNIYNKMYNQKGIEKSLEYKFRYENGYFDFVFLTSVFTHMHAKDVNHYLIEISRVMKPGGSCFITFFLLNNETDEAIKNGISTLNLINQLDEHSCSQDANVPERAIGFKEKYILEVFAKNNLIIKKPIYYGSWSGRKDYKSYQDIIIAEKK